MSDARRRKAETWAARLLGWDDWTSEPISSDAGFRRYYRLGRDDRFRVVMDAPDESDDTEVFTDIAERLRRTGVHVPGIDAHDAEAGLMLLEDLGRSSYLSALDGDTADTLFEQAQTALIRIQARADTTGLPAYSESMLQAELDLFIEWYLRHHRGIVPDSGQMQSWHRVCELLIRNIQRQPQVFVHRDFMPRNLLVSDPNPGIIDFQDAVAGPLAYDPVCLYRDAFISWPGEKVDTWLETYRRRAADAGLPVPDDPDAWRRICDLTGVQRHLKVIGIFARLCYRDSKPRYLEDTPRFYTYLYDAIERNPELMELGRLLRAWRAPEHGD